MGAAEQPQGGEALGEAVRIPIEAQHRLQGGEADLAQPQGAFEGVELDRGNEVLAPHQQPGLGAAEELVAGEGHQIGAGGEGLPGGRFVRQAPALQVGQGAGAQIDDERQTPLMGQAGQFRLRHGLSEALDGVVAGMDLHQQGGARANGGGEVPPMGAVGGADLDEPGAGAPHDVGDTEGAADLDELAPGDDDLLLARQGVEQQEDAGGIVVDHRGGLGTGEFP